MCTISLSRTILTRTVKGSSSHVQMIVENYLKEDRYEFYSYVSDLRTSISCIVLVACDWFLLFSIQSVETIEKIEINTGYACIILGFSSRTLEINFMKDNWMV